MKTFFSLALLLLSFGAAGQSPPADSATGKVVYRGAVPLPVGVTPTQAFGRSKIWLADAFASQAVMADDAATGLLSGAGALRVRGIDYVFRVRLEIAASTVRYRLDEFRWSTPGPGAANRGTLEEQRDSRLAIGRGMRVKILAELDQKVRSGLGQLGTDLAGVL